MDDDTILSKIVDRLPDLSIYNQCKILSIILLLLEAQRQGVKDYPLSMEL